MLFIHNHLTFRKWCYTPLQHDFAVDPIIPPFDFHFRIYKCDLTILTEWWQQRIAWWELINAACQIIWSIICIRKQHSNHMEDDTFKRILQDKQFHLQIKAEQKEIIQNVLERKDSMAECYQRASERACVTSPLFWTRYYIIFFLLMVICNSLLLLKSLPINIINCIKFYVNCSAWDHICSAYDWQ